MIHREDNCVIHLLEEAKIEFANIPTRPRNIRLLLWSNNTRYPVPSREAQHHRRSSASELY